MVPTGITLPKDDRTAGELTWRKLRRKFGHCEGQQLKSSPPYCNSWKPVEFATSPLIANMCDMWSVSPPSNDLGIMRYRNISVIVEWVATGWRILNRRQSKKNCPSKISSFAFALAGLSGRLPGCSCSGFFYAEILEASLSFPGHDVTFFTEIKVSPSRSAWFHLVVGSWNQSTCNVRLVPRVYLNWDLSAVKASSTNPGRQFSCGVSFSQPDVTTKSGWCDSSCWREQQQISKRRLLGWKLGLGKSMTPARPKSRR